MSCLNKPDRISCDAFSDSNLKFNNTGGNYTSFNNVLQQPLLNVRGLQLIRANFVNPVLQLNDNNQLMFFYYTAAAAAGIVNPTNLKVVRLYPSDFIPAAGFTAFTRNEYFNTVAELIVALNAAASSGGDSITYNPKWLVNDVEFTYDSASRKIKLVIVRIAPEKDIQRLNAAIERHLDDAVEKANGGQVHMPVRSLRQVKSRRYAEAGYVEPLGAPDYQSSPQDSRMVELAGRMISLDSCFFTF
jgi:hypothetical protein